MTTIRHKPIGPATRCDDGYCGDCERCDPPVTCYGCGDDTPADSTTTHDAETGERVFCVQCEGAAEMLCAQPGCREDAKTRWCPDHDPEARALVWHRRREAEKVSVLCAMRWRAGDE